MLQVQGSSLNLKNKKPFCSPFTASAHLLNTLARREVHTHSRGRRVSLSRERSRRGCEEAIVEEREDRERGREKFLFRSCVRTTQSVNTDTMERPSRRNANKAAKAQAATAGLKDLKDKGLKRFDTLADAEDKNVYDVVRGAFRFLSSHAARVWRLCTRAFC